MALWFALAIMTASVLLFLLRPLFRAETSVRARTDFDLAVWRDQLAELARDVEQGVLSDVEAASARLEIERRILRGTAETAERTRATPRIARLSALATLLFVPIVTVILYLRLGAPGVPDAPLAARHGERPLLRADGSLDLAKARQGLEAKLREHPDSLEGWLLLGRTDGALEDWVGARTAYDRAVMLSKRDPAVLEAFGDLLVTEAQGTVTPQARALFEEAAAVPTNYRARYYLALGKAQQGDLAGAVGAWRALEADAPTGAPWLEAVKGAIAGAERMESSPPAPEARAEGTPPPEMAAMMSLPPEQRADAIRSMVAGLAARLDQHPDDLDGWKRLGRSYLVLGEARKSADAYERAATLAPQDASILLDQAQALQAIEPETAPLSPGVLALYRKVATMAPDRPEPLWFLGLAAKEAGHKDEAVAEWRKLLALIPPDSADATEVKKAIAELGG